MDVLPVFFWSFALKVTVYGWNQIKSICLKVSLKVEMGFRVLQLDFQILKIDSLSYLKNSQNHRRGVRIEEESMNKRKGRREANPQKSSTQTDQYKQSIALHKRLKIFLSSSLLAWYAYWSSTYCRMYVLLSLQPV